MITNNKFCLNNGYGNVMMQKVLAESADLFVNLQQIAVLRKANNSVMHNLSNSHLL